VSSYRTVLFLSVARRQGRRLSARRSPSVALSTKAFLKCAVAVNGCRAPGVSGGLIGCQEYFMYILYVFIVLWRVWSSVSDPHSFNPDPDPDPA
jgi:hypothetical protein